MPPAGTVTATGHAPTITIGLDAATVDQKIAERTNARKNKDFARADAIRDELAEAGIALEDTAQGTTWRRA